MALGMGILRSPYTPYSIYLRGTINLEYGMLVIALWVSRLCPGFNQPSEASCLGFEGVILTNDPKP